MSMSLSPQREGARGKNEWRWQLWQQAERERALRPLSRDGAWSATFRNMDQANNNVTLRCEKTGCTHVFMHFDCFVMSKMHKPVKAQVF